MRTRRRPARALTAGRGPDIPLRPPAPWREQPDPDWDDAQLDAWMDAKVAPWMDDPLEE